MTKRILQSGFTPQHVGSGTRFKYDSVAKLYANMLGHAGYEVEHRRVVPDEDISGYDALFFGLSPLNSFSARYQYAALGAIADAKAAGVPVIYYIDDWQSHLVAAGAKTMSRDHSRLVKTTYNGDNKTGAVCRVDWDWARENLDKLTPVVDELAWQPWGSVVMPLYENGDWSKFDARLPEYRRLSGIDPTAFYTPYDTVIPEDSERERSWVFGILSDQRKWMDGLNLEWPLAHKGGRASKADEGMPEPELVQMYANSWGVLSCPYWHSGSGWFRIRHEHAMGTRSVLYSEGELDFISDAFSVKISEAEGMSNQALRELADAQADAWYANKLSKDVAAERLRGVVEDEIAGLK